MVILKADTIVTMDEKGTIIKDGAIAFDEKIRAVSHSALRLRKEYPDATFVQAPKDSVVFPALINPHLHFEFSKNKTELVYGDFHRWLGSVIEKREYLMEESEEMIASAISFVAKTGTATVGAVSSYGYDMKALASSPLRVVFFHEAIGSKPELVETMFSHLVSRIDDSLAYRSSRFTPAIAIHSPYSVHPELIKLALDEAKKGGMKVSTHFMESPEERAWLEHNEGKFAPFFKSFLNMETSFITPQKFLEMFDGHTPLMTHAIHTTPKEQALLKEIGASVVHCPVSNRLLGAGVAPFKAYQELEVPLLLGTDGLSSNRSLSLFDEMRAGLFVHASLPLEETALSLFKGCTTHAAHALGSDNGELVVGKYADIALVTLPEVSPLREDFFTQLILHTQTVDTLYIQGKKYE